MRFNSFVQFITDFRFAKEKGILASHFISFTTHTISPESITKYQH